MMKKQVLLTAATALASFALALPAAAQTTKAQPTPAAVEAPAAPTLKLGDPAPKLQVGKWVQGEPVKGFEPGKTYIVEFWATWCAPCIATIPHLNQLHAKFKDKNLVVIGQNVSEEDESKVDPFVKKMGDKMTYRVALDDKSKVKDGAMSATWMEASGQNGIPAAFIVNKAGKITWIGHPSGLTEKLLEDILADRFDLNKAVAEAEKQAKEEAELKQIEPQLRQAGSKLQTAIEGKKWAEAESAVTELEKLLPVSRRAGLSLARFHILTSQTNYPAAYKLVGAVSEANPNDAQLQFSIAQAIVFQEGLQNRDLTIAEKAAERANKATEGKEPGILNLMARIQFMNGKKPEAIATQQKAVDLADERIKGALEKVLASYKAGKLPSAE